VYPDCDDSDADVNPGTPETWYDGVDNDCDGGANDDDADGDGFGWDGNGGQDCNDEDPAIHPDATDWCATGVDENCDGQEPACGFDEEMVASDASVQIRRDPDEVLFSGGFGYDATPVGDGDHNGQQEFIARLSAGPDSDEFEIYGKDSKDYYSAFLLIEPPSQGVVLPQATAIAAWTTNQQGRANSQSAAHPVVGGHDLDGDGYSDYIFSTEASFALADEEQERSSRLDLWYGPTQALMNLDDGAQTLDPPTDRWDARLSFGPIYLLDDPEEGDDWTLAALVWTALELGVSTPAVVLATAETFEGTRSLDESTAVWSTGGLDVETGSLLDVGDFDGDGLRDLAIGSKYAKPDDDPPMRIWTLFGPDFVDRWVLDADVTIMGDQGDHSDIRLVDLPEMDHPDGPVVAAWLTPRDAGGWYFFTLPASGTVTADDAFASIIEDDDYYPWDTLAWSNDADANGAPELALKVGGGYKHASGVVLMDVPESGVVAISDHRVRIDEDPNPWNDHTGTSSDLGTAIIADVDWNGDGFTDLLLGEPQWDDFVGKEICCYRYGRIGIFHGGPGGY
jgi:hypothetical protein